MQGSLKGFFTAPSCLHGDNFPRPPSARPKPKNLAMGKATGEQLVGYDQRGCVRFEKQPVRGRKLLQYP